MSQITRSQKPTMGFSAPPKQPALFGIKYSNRNFNHPDSWGKNKFNSAFPAALACYMHSQNINPIYMALDSEGRLVQQTISVTECFAIDPLGENTYYAFESDFVPYQQLVVGNLPRIDLVILEKQSAICQRGLEIKLTALPDNATYHLTDEFYGSEIVVRPDTIVYVALSIAYLFKDDPTALRRYFSQYLPNTFDWTDAIAVIPLVPLMAQMLNHIMLDHLAFQHPLMLQPIWKTQGKYLLLHEDALDIFVWSNYAFTRLFFHVAALSLKTIGRPARSIVWLAKMLSDFAANGVIDYHQVIDQLSFNTKNDKAFSMSGAVTNPLMRSTVLTKPRIKREELKNIILGGGQNLLSPERRLDAAILNTPNLFSGDNELEND